MNACRPTPEYLVREIYTFEVLSSTEWVTSQLEPFIPNIFVEISELLEVKRKVLQAYQLGMLSAPHTRNILHVEHLALHQVHFVGVDAAEAFISKRNIK